ncbi:tetratricopeptide repeat protein [candidate division KSB1 bacterium]|nr:tetratricopeptide repeat protein [candidate division KSB1 bacterium]
MSTTKALIYRFGNFTLEVNEHRLLEGVNEIFLRPRVFETLLYLIQQHGHLVTKQELLDQVWSGVIVSETTLTHCIEEIRKAIKDDARHPRYLKTISRVGYKFMAGVEAHTEPLPEPPMPASAASFPEQRPQAKNNLPDAIQSPRGWVRFNLMVRHVAATVWATLQRGLTHWKMVTLLVLITGLGLGGYWRFKTRSVRNVSLAVMPFLNLSAEPDQEYFVDGLTEALISDLANISGLKVISRTSSMRYKGTPKSIPEIGHELQVDFIVEGSVLRSEEKVRISAQLIQVKSDQHWWAESYARDLHNILALQSDVTRAIAAAIQIKLTPQDQRRISHRHQIHADAYHAYLKGRYFWNKRTEEGFRKGIEYFQQTIDLDPDYAPAYTGLADCYNLLADYDLISPRAANEPAQAAARQALTLDPTLAEALASAGFAKTRYDWDWVGGEAEFKRALASNPNYSIAHHWYALQLAMLGRFTAALAQIQRAQELDPLSLIINTNLGWLFYFNRQYDQARTQLLKTVEMDSDFMSAHVKLGWVYEQQGLYPQAIAAFQKALALSGGDLNIRALLANTLARAGQPKQAAQILTTIHQQAQQKYVSAYWIAIVYASLGAHEKTFQWLERAYTEHSVGLVWLKVDPKWDDLRTDSRFNDLLARIGLD